jgi:hypothetical protein
MTKIVTEAMLPCPFCPGPVHRRTEHGVEGCFHIAMPHCPVASHRLMTVEQWNHRTTMSTAQEPALDDDAEWDAVIAAYITGATDVHKWWVEADATDRAFAERDADPDFTEAAHDYASDRLQAKAPETD